eukprot:3168029-Pleurochrysis_carterae.AAC.1
MRIRRGLAALHGSPTTCCAHCRTTRSAAMTCHRGCPSGRPRRRCPVAPGRRPRCRPRCAHACGRAVSPAASPAAAAA